MTAEVTATPDHAAGDVTVTGSGLGAGPVTVSRIGRDGRGVPVRGAVSLPIVGGALTVLDYECPLGVPVSYRVTEPDGTLTDSAPLTLATAHPILSHPGIVGARVPLRIVRDDAGADARTVLFEVIGRADPVPSAAPMGSGSGSLTVLVDSVPAADALAWILADGWPVLLRTPCGDLFRDGWLAVTRSGESAPNPGRGSRTVTLDYRRVARPADAPYATRPWRLADVDDAFATLADVDGAYATLADVDRGMPV